VNIKMSSGVGSADPNGFTHLEYNIATFLVRRC